MLFLECQLKDSDILEVLSYEGYETGRCGVVGLKKELGLIRKSTSSKREEKEQQLKEIVQMKLNNRTI